MLFEWDDRGMLHVPDAKSLPIPSANTTNKHNSAVHRKIIVFENARTKQFVLAVGPTFSRSPMHLFYYHARLVRAARRTRALREYRCRGGGEIILTSNKVLWEATFGDYSETYGVFDPRILVYRKKIAKWIGLRTRFEWKATI